MNFALKERVDLNVNSPGVSHLAPEARTRSGGVWEETNY